MKKKKIKFLFVGDFCTQHPEKIKLSQNIVNLLDECDYKILNFEGPLAKGKLNIPNKTVLPQSSLSPEWCEKNGFNIISLANNHAYDYGSEGLVSTIDSFQQSLIVGVGGWNEAYKIKIIETDGVKVGLISATACDFASLKDKWTDYNKIGCAWINSPEINKLILKNKSKCDYLFIIAHGGIEYMNIPLPEWRDRYRELIDLGADAIIASHPHVPQGTELYKDRPIFYSLGNFYFDILGKKKPKFWDNGVLGIIEIHDERLNYSVIPTIRNGNNLDVDISSETERHMHEITMILQDDEKYMNQVNVDVLNFYSKYKNWLLSGFNAQEMRFNLKHIYFILRSLISSKSKPNLKSAMHQIREESTRWLIARALKIKSRTDL